MPETVADMRPIALSNVLYRIMAKLIANRMKSLMGDIISESQSAFIPGRLITDNILITAEVGHYLNRKQCGITGWGALKLNMAKAYDRMECGRLIPTRGLRQGDPLSPYLFIICAEANTQEAGVIKECLKRYEELSGQKVNYHKSNICFSKNTREEDREMVAECLQVDQAPNFGKYLWLPSFIGRNKRMMLSYNEDKIKQRIGSWNKKLLSRAEDHEQYWSGSGGERGFTGKPVINYVSLRSLVVWDLRISKALIWLCWENKHDVFSQIPAPWLQRFIKHGVRRRIGDGKTTLIWGYPWLPDDPSPLVQTDMPEELRHAKVAGLIDGQTNMWDPHILSDLFNTEDVNRILRIPVSPGLPVTNIVTDSFPVWLTAALAILTEEQSGVLVVVLYHL
ncbi:PREDICTED: uncharacterized protein LOC109184456 [Ipomoea nil]|uniref:uncharacterized protein LOC109184456 n=1 Tax=Ipomoea nil TaxID=35883 RepID=UPI000900941A|nr:PREDICTED: uncharacterized protein LOC109184456 [Ipomoea nil]